MNYFKNSLIIYLTLFIALIGGGIETYSNYKKNEAIIQAAAYFAQPPLPAGIYPWTIRSIDTQVVSKHWPDVTRPAIQEQVRLLSELGVNYIAIGTPYDRTDEIRMWAQEIHALGINVWFRSHWAEWEGDDGKPATMTPDDYLYRTSQFIEQNPDLFFTGDAFTVAVEPEQVGVGLGKRFLTWERYRNFLLSQISVASESFEKIGLGGKVHTNWLSVNGWVVENQFTPELVDKLDLIVVDHFVSQSKTIGEFDDADVIVQQTIADLDRYHAQWGVPILLGEWGYQIFQPVPDGLQAEVINKLFSQLARKSYLVGINYWVHMGNSAAIIGDEFGSNLKYREGALVIKSYYDPLAENAFTLTPIQ